MGGDGVDGGDVNVGGDVGDGDDVNVGGDVADGDDGDGLTFPWRCYLVL